MDCIFSLAKNTAPYEDEETVSYNLERNVNNVDQRSDCTFCAV